MAYQSYDLVTFNGNQEGIVVTCNDNKDRVFFKSPLNKDVIMYYTWKNEKEYGRSSTFNVNNKLPQFLNAGLLEYIQKGIDKI